MDAIVLDKYWKDFRRLKVKIEKTIITDVEKKM